jgi:HD-GYP domain-containing protein (c-di-GMP phosphodiesterase class II)
MTDFDPLHDKAYTERLTLLGEKREIIASEDIYNDQGVLLVRKGSPINQKIADKIVRFKLVKPIESSVDVANSLGAAELFKDLLTAVKQYPQVLMIHQRANIEPTIKQLCSAYARYPIIRQKLTVMREQMPKLYWQSVSVTWLAVLVAIKMKLTDQQVEICFMAGLCHDIGMMHIDPLVVEKKEELSPAEWRQIQAHTVISYKVLESVNGIKPAIAQAVLEHHERCDGTGYPNGRFAHQLTLESQVVALAESVIAVYRKRLVPNGRNLRDLMPLLQVNSESHFYDTYKALILVLRNADLDEKPFLTNETIDGEVNKLKQKNDLLSHMLQGLESLMSQFKDRSDHKLLVSARTILVQILRIVRGSGILDEGYLRWLEQVRKEKLTFAYREVDDVTLMLDEIEWHTLRIKKTLDVFLQSIKDEKLKSVIQQGLKEVQQDISPAADEYSIN